GMKKTYSPADQEWLDNYQKEKASELEENFHDPRIKGLIRMRCRNWLDLALEVKKAMGDEGVELIKKARFESAQEVAKEIREKYGADVQGIYRCYQDILPWHKPIWEVAEDGLPHGMTFRCKCQVGEYWKERLEQDPDALDLCRIFCSWDDEVARHVDPAIRCEMSKWYGDGDSFCELIWTTSASGKAEGDS
ncbi:MAG: L-2-amino-thiazoline-4-carboxylic acid hydrolase, partial [Desulfarculaceae bacterium]